MHVSYDLIKHFILNIKYNTSVIVSLRKCCSTALCMALGKDTVDDIVLCDVKQVWRWVGGCDAGDISRQPCLLTHNQALPTRWGAAEVRYFHSFDRDRWRLSFHGGAPSQATKMQTPTQYHT